MNNQDNAIIETEISAENQQEEQSAGLWHYIRTFCSFFAIITSFTPIIIMTEMRTHYLGFAVVLWVLGIISALLVSPLKFVKFGWKLISKCAVFGWFVLPFPFDLASVAASVLVGVIGAIMAVVVFPAIFTIYTYFTDIRYYCVDNKKEFIAIGSAIVGILIAVILFFTMHGITTAIEVPVAQNNFDAVATYNTYREKNSNAKELSADILNNPESSEFSEDGYVCTNVYKYDGNVGYVKYNYTETVEFEYKDGEWIVSDDKLKKEIASFDTINGTWTGKGEYPANFSDDNNFKITFNNLTENGGSGTLSVFPDGAVDEHRDFTVEVGEMETKAPTTKNGENEVLLNLTLNLDTPLECTNFTTVTIPKVECQFSLTENTITTYTFNFFELILTAEQ